MPAARSKNAFNRTAFNVKAEPEDDDVVLLVKTPSEIYARQQKENFMKSLVEGQKQWSERMKARPQPVRYKKHTTKAAPSSTTRWRRVKAQRQTGELRSQGFGDIRTLGFFMVPAQSSQDRDVHEQFPGATSGAVLPFLDEGCGLDERYKAGSSTNLPHVREEEEEATMRGEEIGIDSKERQRLLQQAAEEEEEEETDPLPANQQVIPGTSRSRTGDPAKPPINLAMPTISAPTDKTLLPSFDFIAPNPRRELERYPLPEISPNVEQALVPENLHTVPVTQNEATHDIYGYPNQQITSGYAPYQNTSIITPYEGAWQYQEQAQYHYLPPAPPSRPLRFIDCTSRILLRFQNT